MKAIVLPASVMILLCINAQAADIPKAAVDPRILYDLREKCGRDAQAWYQHFFIDLGAVPKQTTITSDFNSHYNEHLNKCFVLTATLSSLKAKGSSKTEITESHDLADVLENKDVGSYFRFVDRGKIMDCHVGTEHCTSQDGWDALIAPYMEQ